MRNLLGEGEEMTGIYIYIAANIIFGLISCFFGKKLYFPILMITVFISAVTLGVSACGTEAEVWIYSALAGIAAAVLARFLYKLGVFFMGGILGGGLGMLLAAVFMPSIKDYHWVIAAALAAVFGICAVRWNSIFIMASTAYNGAVTASAPLCLLAIEFRSLGRFISADGIAAASAGISRYLNGSFSEQNSFLLFIVTVILTAAGFIYQRRTAGLDS